MEEQASREVTVFPKVAWKEPTDWNRTPSIYPGCIGLNGTSFRSLQKTVFFPFPCIHKKNKESSHNCMLSHPKSMWMFYLSPCEKCFSHYWMTFVKASEWEEEDPIYVPKKKMLQIEFVYLLPNPPINHTLKSRPQVFWGPLRLEYKITKAVVFLPSSCLLKHLHHETMNEMKRISTNPCSLQRDKSIPLSLYLL